MQTKSCPRCRQFKVFEVTVEQLQRFKMGMHIQYVFPDMTPEDRERFITGYCPKCWDALFADEENGR